MVAYDIGIPEADYIVQCRFLWLDLLKLLGRSEIKLRDESLRLLSLIWARFSFIARGGEGGREA